MGEGRGKAVSASLSVGLVSSESSLVAVALVVGEICPEMAWNRRDGVCLGNGILCLSSTRLVLIVSRVICNSDSVETPG